MKIESAFFCDDFRKEDNGKLMFIGCYASDIVLGEQPTADRPLYLPLKLVLCGEIPETDKIEIEITVNAKSILKGVLTAQTTASSFVFLPIPLQPLQFTETGTMELKIKQSSSKWKIVRMIEVKPPIDSTTSQRG